MRKVLIGLIGLICLVLVFVGCDKRWEEEWYGYTAPNWTSDNRIIFMRNHYIQKWEQDPFWGGTREIGWQQDIFVCEIDVDGSNFREVCKIVDDTVWHAPISTSSAGDYVVISKEDWSKGEHYTEMFILKRDGTGFTNLSEGSWPDLSPDGKKFVYQKFNQGLWIKNIDGSGDRQIVADENAMQPTWSGDGGRIAYIFSSSASPTEDSLCVTDTSGNLLHAFWLRASWPDWGPPDSNSISFLDGYFYNGNEGWHHIGIIHLVNNSIDTLTQFKAGGIPKWSYDGEWFIAADAEGYFVIKRDGTNKWYLKP